MTAAIKQVIVVDAKLQLPRGKLAAQVAHAAVASFLTASPDMQRRWLEQGMPKVVLRADGEESLLRLEADASKLRLPCELIRDAGHTVVAAGTLTCLGIGPAEAQDIDSLTGALRLL